MLYEILAATNAATATTTGTPEWLVGLIYVIVGFVLGLFGNLILDVIRTHKKKKYFCIAVCSELKQLLVSSIGDMTHLDADVEKEKIKLLYESHKKYALTKEAFMFVDNLNVDDLFRDAEKAVAMFKRMKDQRKIEGNMMSLKKINCNFINNNFEIIGLLEKDKTSRIINLINRIETRNHFVDGINDAYSRSFDNPTSRDIVKHNYYSFCQQLSDSGVILTRVIIDLIDLLSNDKDNK